MRRLVSLTAPALRAALLLALLPLAACDGDEPLAANTFTLRVAGGETQARSDAYFGTYLSADVGDSEVFALFLGGDPASETDSLSMPSVGFVRVGGEEGPGVYALSSLGLSRGPAEGAAFGFYVDPAQFEDETSPLDRGGFFFAQSGVFTLDEIDGERAVGSFTMTVAGFGDDFEPDAATAFTVEGEFNAVVSDGFGSDASVFERRALVGRWPF